MWRGTILFITACAVALAIAVGASVGSRSWSPGPGRYQHSRMTERGDTYSYSVYVPASRRPGSAVPLVVVLHGCTMTADQMAAASSFDTVAERDRFIVLYPDVDAIDAAYGRCWKGIWEPRAEGRGLGDAGAIAEMTADVIARWHVDRSRVYAIGISAGGLESAILGAEYPDLYAAIGIHSGVAYDGAEPGCEPSNGLAGAALAAMGPHARVMPVIVIHGDKDGKVPYRCGEQALSQWLGADDLVLEHEHRAPLPRTPTRVFHAAVHRRRAYAVDSYTEQSGCLVAQLWTVHGMGHFWSGGSNNPDWAPYSDPRGPSAAAASWAFFSRWSLSGTKGTCAPHQ